MNLSLQDLQAEAAATGFSPDTLDKVIRLLDLLNAFRSHPFLKDRMVLKGGTALNLFVFDLPRLSVDIDLNYVGSADRKVMLAEREKVEQAIMAVCGRAGFTLRRIPHAHAGGKWRLGYTNAFGRNANLEIDVIFTLRVPLWPIQIRDSHVVWPDSSGDVRGESLAPLYKSAPNAARRDSELYELLVIADALRAGRTREKMLATKELKKRLKNYG